MKRILSLFILILVLLLIGGSLHPAKAQYDTAYDIINGVNAVRASYGLPALEVNTNLMGAAQAQSDYQASIETVTHLNEEGSTAILRAAQFGYGGGSEIVIAENVYAAYKATAVMTITDWSKDAHNLQSMIGPYLHIGAGVTIRNGVVYYTLIVGHLAGDPGTGAEVPEDLSDSDPLFIVSTPRADGSIVHIVGFGHTLITIAEKYGTTLEELMALNNLTEDSIIYAGEELIIQPPTSGPTFTPSGPTFTPNPTTPTVPPSPTIEPSRTPRPTRTLNPTDEIAIAQVTEAPSQSPSTPPSTAPPEPGSPAFPQRTAQIALIALILVAGGLVLLGNLFDRRRGKKEQ